MPVSEARAFSFFVGSVVVLIAILVCIWIGHSHMEAKSYERVTGNKVSLVDAMFLQLRVSSDTKD